MAGVAGGLVAAQVARCYIPAAAVLQSPAHCSAQADPTQFLLTQASTVLTKHLPTEPNIFSGCQKTR